MEFNSLLMFCGRERFCLPDLFIETFLSAVEMIHIVVHGERVFFAVQRELPFRDAVRDAPGNRSEKRMPLEILIERIKTQYDMSEFAVAVRRLNVGDDQPVIRHLDDGSLAVGEREQLHRFAIHRAPVLFLQSCHRRILGAGAARVKHQRHGQRTTCRENGKLRASGIFHRCRCLTGQPRNRAIANLPRSLPKQTQAAFYARLDSRQREHRYRSTPGDGRDISQASTRTKPGAPFHVQWKCISGVFPVFCGRGTWFRLDMKKEAKGKLERGQAGRRIPIEVFSTQRWALPMKHTSIPARDDAGTCGLLNARISPLCARELNLGTLFVPANQKLAA